MVPLNAFFYETPLFLEWRHIAHLVVLLGTLRFMASDCPIFLDVPGCKLEAGNKLFGVPKSGSVSLFKGKTENI